MDHFIGAEHEARGLTPRPEAPRHVLLRRRLPRPDRPAADARGAARVPGRRVPGRLREGRRPAARDPRYGERGAGTGWTSGATATGRATTGTERQQPHIWRWRDWIIESLNADKGYDRMVREMLAADELAPDDPKRCGRPASSARNWYKFNRNVWLEDTRRAHGQGVPRR